MSEKDSIEKDGPAKSSNEPTEERFEAGGAHYWQYCVNCGTMLQSRKCKLICPKCGFYHSCSEP